ncbi:hypothetical protein PMYN1_Chma85 (chromatophore) [Paulinella micropora]|uniref:Uncharacterized protein n=1 Tax=Paulinella micropora TaxID=1928728 RepID=A0A1L5YB40_9EUKA|nr:hypothetical protein PCKR_123 [Paulinella micropora]AQX44689.1 hypothetical protein PFK_123 [Paulinella micropora]BBL85897.1 hypothetical protein PMYN1_Chma85 [Paulinella micropora]
MNNSSKGGVVILQSHLGIILGIFGLACILFAFGMTWDYILWIAFPIFTFGIFLGLQSQLLKIEFTDYSFDVSRGNHLLRRFPYENWLHWRLFWPRLPILFYFREEKSIHFLPIIFGVKKLRQELDQRLTHEYYPNEI